MHQFTPPRAGTGASGGRLHSGIVLLIGWGFLALAAALTARVQSKDLPEKTAVHGKPFTEWTLEYPEAEGNRYDVIASATFTHEESGETKRSLMFYTGQGDTWKLRFTGTKTGHWTIETEGPGNLGGWRGTVRVTESVRLPGALPALRPDVRLRREAALPGGSVPDSGERSVSAEGLHARDDRPRPLALGHGRRRGQHLGQPASAQRQRAWL